MSDPSQSGLESHQTGAVRPEEAAGSEVPCRGFHRLVADVRGDQQRRNAGDSGFANKPAAQAVRSRLPRVDARRGDGLLDRDDPLRAELVHDEEIESFGRGRQPLPIGGLAPAPEGPKVVRVALLCGCSHLGMLQAVDLGLQQLDIGTHPPACGGKPGSARVQGTGKVSVRAGLALDGTVFTDLAFSGRPASIESSYQFGCQRGPPLQLSHRLGS